MWDTLDTLATSYHYQSPGFPELPYPDPIEGFLSNLDMGYSNNSNIIVSGATGNVSVTAS